MARARQAGWTTWYVPESRVVHLVGRASGAVTDRRHTRRRRPAYWFDSRRRYMLTHLGQPRAVLADICFVAGFLSLARAPRPRREPNDTPERLLPNFLRHGQRTSERLRGLTCQTTWTRPGCSPNPRGLAGARPRLDPPWVPGDRRAPFRQLAHAASVEAVAHAVQRALSGALPRRQKFLRHRAPLHRRGGEASRVRAPARHRDPRSRPDRRRLHRAPGRHAREPENGRPPFGAALGRRVNVGAGAKLLGGVDMETTRGLGQTPWSCRTSPPGPWPLASRRRSPTAGHASRRRPRSHDGDERSKSDHAGTATAGPGACRAVQPRMAVVAGGRVQIRAGAGR